jgi:hypothetical protein
LSYTQAPHLSSSEIESLMREAQIARFCSYNKDGTIHAAPVQYKYEDGKIFVVTPIKSQKIRNVKRNDNVTVLVDVLSPSVMGVIMYGKAVVETLSKKEMFSILERYMAKDKLQVYVEGLFKLSEWAKVTITPVKTASFDLGKDELYRKASQGLL